MPNATAETSSSSLKGFALLELLIFIVVLTGLSVWLLPVALEERKDENQKHAVEYLRMLASAESLWMSEVGTFVELRQVAESVPNLPGRALHLRTPTFAFDPPMLFDVLGVGHRGGYRYRSGHNSDGRIVGCWAWPNLREYSGLATFWLDFKTQQVFEAPIAASWNDTPGTLAPDATGLTPVHG
ncbi:MAG: hypothetical protein O3A95_01060 [Planctomycetota bacterium]|nr:hypothetical protein [Planctomycetota bacterium]MDA1112874.1 hypothetical protein [Planctomycetota bacterium]